MRLTTSHICCFMISRTLTNTLGFIIIGLFVWDLGSKVNSTRILTGQTISGNPSLVTCPTANCPAPPSKSVLSTVFVHGETSKGSDQAEWLANMGLLVKSGSPDGQKVTEYLGVMQQAGAGTAWTLNTDLVRNAVPGGPNAFGGLEGSGMPGRPGAIGERNGSIGYELDFTNWDANSSPGQGAFTVGQYVHAQGSYTSLSALYFDAHMDQSNGNAGWSDGILFNGDRVVKDNTFFDATNAVSSMTVAGHHSYGLNTTPANANMRAVIMRAGQTICFDGPQRCLSWHDSKLTYTNLSGETVFSIDERGNAFFSGHITSR